MKDQREIDALLKEQRDWLNPPSDLIARPIELPPMVPIKDVPDHEDED